MFSTKTLLVFWVIPNWFPKRTWSSWAGPAQLLHVPSAHEANKDTTRRGLFRRCVVALNAYVDACKADPFHATFTAFKAGVKKYVRDRRVWMLIVMCMLRLVICVTLLMYSCILHRIHAHVVYLNGVSSVLLFRFCLLSISSASDFSFLL